MKQLILGKGNEKKSERSEGTDGRDDRLTTCSRNGTKELRDRGKSAPERGLSPQLYHNVEYKSG